MIFTSVLSRSLFAGFQFVCGIEIRSECYFAPRPHLHHPRSCYCCCCCCCFRCCRCCCLPSLLAIESSAPSFSRSFRSPIRVCSSRPVGSCSVGHHRQQQQQTASACGSCFATNSNEISKQRSLPNAFILSIAVSTSAGQHGNVDPDQPNI